MAEFLTEPILAWRVWHVRRHGEDHRLESLTRHDVSWPFGRRLEASCATHRTAAPAVGHECGIYAFRTREQAEQLLHRYLGVPGRRDGLDAREHGMPVPGRLLALGCVSLWGRILARENGYRAQYAYPYEIFLVAGDERIARALRRRYAVDVWRS